MLPIAVSRTRNSIRQQKTPPLPSPLPPLLCKRLPFFFEARKPASETRHSTLPCKQTPLLLYLSCFYLLSPLRARARSAAHCETFRYYYSNQNARWTPKKHILLIFCKPQTIFVGADYCSNAKNDFSVFSFPPWPPSLARSPLDDHSEGAPESGP